MGGTRPQTVEGRGVLAHGDKLLGANAQEVALGGVTGIVEGVHRGRQPQADQLVGRGAVFAVVGHTNHVADGGRAVTREVVGGRGVGHLLPREVDRLDLLRVQADDDVPGGLFVGVTAVQGTGEGRGATNPLDRHGVAVELEPVVVVPELRVRRLRRGR